MDYKHMLCSVYKVCFLLLPQLDCLCWRAAFDEWKRKSQVHEKVAAELKSRDTGEFHLHTGCVDSSSLVLQRRPQAAATSTMLTDKLRVSAFCCTQLFMLIVP